MSKIKDELQECHSSLSYEEIKGMPATMQIVAATDDQVSERMKDLSNRLLNPDMAPERKVFLQRLLALPVDDVMTANYGFELEIADGMKPDKRQYSARLHNTFDLQARHKAFRLYQCYETSKGKRIWHVHGDIAKPDTMLMGHYYYAKQLKALQDCVKNTVRRYRICEKNGEEFRSFSWIDQFLTGDVYILGLGMYLCESDLWYLLCCKKRNFPDAKTYFYDMECKDKTISIMMKAYGAKVIDGESLNACEKYEAFYDAALADIEQKIKA